MKLDEAQQIRARRKLRVYRFEAYHLPGVESNMKHGTMRPWECVVASTSKQRVAELVGEKHPRHVGRLGETWNEEDVEAAMAKPGVILYRPDLSKKGTPWKELPADAFDERRKSR